jgi:hypothetical protein
MVDFCVYEFHFIRVVWLACFFLLLIRGGRYDNENNFSLGLILVFQITLWVFYGY